MNAMRGKWTVVNRNHVFAGGRCPLCLATIKSGQVVYYTFDNTHGAVAQHKKCMRAVVNDPEIPIEASEIQFSKIRDAIVGSGNVFVEVG